MTSSHLDLIMLKTSFRQEWGQSIMPLTIAGKPVYEKVYLGTFTIKMTPGFPVRNIMLSEAQKLFTAPKDGEEQYWLCLSPHACKIIKNKQYSGWKKFKCYVFLYRKLKDD